MNALDWAGVVLGGAVLGIGGWLLAIGRGRISRRSGPEPGAWRRIGSGMALAGVGYHVVAWSLPPAWAAFCVPPERWWIVVGVAVLVALGTWRMDAPGADAGPA